MLPTEVKKASPLTRKLAWPVKSFASLPSVTPSLATIPPAPVKRAEPTPAPDSVVDPLPRLTTRSAASAPVDSRDVPPDVTTRFVPAPSAASPLRLSVPALRKTSPVKVLAPCSRSRPEPVLVRPAAPAMVESMVTLVVLPLVAMVGVVPPRVSVPPVRT